MADFIVDWANENDLYFKWHVLFWGQDGVRWMVNEVRNGQVTNNPLTRAQAIANMELYINTVVGRYRGRVDTWEVVNEAFTGWVGQQAWNATPDWRRHIRNRRTVHNAQPNYAFWYEAFANGARGNECGSDFIYYAFRFTRIADPYAKLMYNDFGEHEPGKRNAMAQMVEQINERWRNDPLYDGRLLIGVIGMQGHYSTNQNLNEIRDSIRRFAQTGARIHVTELDVQIPGMYDWGRMHFHMPAERRLTAAEARSQAIFYRDLFRLYVDHANHIDRITFWGIADQWSWLSPSWPLLFEIEGDDIVPKDAFWSVMEVVGIRP